MTSIQIDKLVVNLIKRWVEAEAVQYSIGICTHILRHVFSWPIYYVMSVGTCIGERPG